MLLGMVLILMWMIQSDVLDRSVPHREAQSNPALNRLPLQKDSTSMAPPPITAPPSEIKSSNAEVLGQTLKRMEHASSRHDAMVAALKLWDQDVAPQADLAHVEDSETFFQLAAKRNGMMVQQVSGDMRLLRQLNLPAVMELSPSDSQPPVYLTVSKVEDEIMTLMGHHEAGTLSIQEADVADYWTGIAYIPWKDFYGCNGEIPNYAPKDSVKALKLLLKDIGYEDMDINPTYDAQTLRAVVAVQKKNHLPADGVVGPYTKIVLYNSHKQLAIPYIQKTGAVRP